MQRNRALAALMLSFAAAFVPAAQAETGARAASPERVTDAPPLRCRGLAEAEVFARTELFFGLSRPGGVVTEAEFQAFVDAYVTPRFPDGLTVLTGAGQFRDSSGTIVVEGSKLLVLLVPRRDREADRKIEQIRSDYKRAFQQQSVLRSDDLSCVSF
jgi:Protein of unknown function (DUF3574)